MTSSLPSERALRKWVLRELAQLNGQSNGGALSKEAIRGLHAGKRAEVFAREQHFVAEWEDVVLEGFADGPEVVPTDIAPRVVQVRSAQEAALFRYACLLWSIPVSRGFGRRTRFLVLDRQNEKLIGIFALGDPVYNLTARDELIGWSVGQRNKRLYNVLDAFVLGAVPPYRELLGGKLVAMAAVSDTTRESIRRKYAGHRTEIQRKKKEPRPVLLTTTSALGRSSLYNRLKYGDRLLYRSVGYTKGFGHFHFSESLFQALIEYLSNDGGVPGHRFGQGPNWRMRTLRVALTKLDLDPGFLHHGVRREVFIAPLAEKWVRYLRGELDRPSWYHHDLQEMGEYWKTRWALPRASRDESFRRVKAADVAVFTHSA